MFLFTFNERKLHYTSKVFLGKISLSRNYLLNYYPTTVEFSHISLFFIIILLSIFTIPTSSIKTFQLKLSLPFCKITTKITFSSPLFSKK